MMGILAQSSAEMIHNFSKTIETREGGQAIFYTLVIITGFRNHLEAGIEITDAARARIVTIGDFVSKSDGDN